MTKELISETPVGPERGKDVVESAGTESKAPETAAEMLHEIVNSADAQERMVQEVLRAHSGRFSDLLEAARGFDIDPVTQDVYTDFFNELNERLEADLAFLSSEFDRLYAEQDKYTYVPEEVSRPLSRALRDKNVVSKAQTELQKTIGEIEVVPDNNDEDVVAKYLSIDTEKLFAEKEFLEQRAEAFQPLIHEMLSPDNEHALNNSEVEAIFEKVVGRLRSETSIFSKYDEEGVDVFAEDLTKQPGVEGLNKIVFTPDVHSLSKEDKDILANASSVEEITPLIEGDKVCCDDEVDLANLKKLLSVKLSEGKYDEDTNRLYINKSHPTLLSRQKSFLRHGGIGGVMDTLVHEVRHHRQRELLPKGLRALEEAQAYVEYPLSSSVESLRGVVSSLRRYAEGDTDAAILMTEAVERLNAMGLSQQEISEVLSTVTYDPEKKDYPNLKLVVNQEMKKRNIGHGDVDVLRDVFRVNRIVDKMKIRDVVREEIVNSVGKERLNQVLQVTENDCSVKKPDTDTPNESPVFLVSDNALSTYNQRIEYRLHFEDEELLIKKVSQTLSDDGSIEYIESEDIPTDDSRLVGIIQGIPSEKYGELQYKLSTDKRAEDDEWFEKVCDLSDRIESIINDA